MSTQILKISSAAALAAALAFSVAQAEVNTNGPLVSNLAAMLVTTDTSTGQEVLQLTEEVVPGDLIEYQITYTNVSQSPIGGVTVTGPMPPNTEYVAGSAAAVSGHLEVSIDSGNSWEQEPVIRMEKNEVGQLVQVIIEPTEYTHVRWIGADPISPQNSVKYKYRVEVE